ncbi:MAG: carboxypeptidase regulatory-like domain-containing protein, partial [Gammaproteobacteria bacterium]|nr:carboxypeptidase regulatory-like domain-containing protein [Gammaproteobacteria bacterium]
MKDQVFRTTLLPACLLSLLLTACGQEGPVDSDSLQTTSTDVPEAGISPAMDDDDIAGVVNGPDGPEAGVWVIAETEEFETFFARIVVTNDQGQFLIPDLPDASYQVWVRGYGLVDSARTTSQPGSTLNLSAQVAASPLEAAQIYPAAYWYSMMGLPAEDELEGVDGGLNAYLTWMKNMGCVGCHQLGNEATRTIPESLGEFESHAEAWLRRVASGQAGAGMVGQLSGRLNSVPFKYLGEWTERVAAGDFPSTQPERPSGLERNAVITVRDWSTPTAYMHDLSGTDRRDPTVNGYGPLFGAPELSTDEFPILYPQTNTASHFVAPVRDADTPTTASTAPNAPSPYWGDQVLWDSKANAHNPMLDQDGR